MPIKIVDTVVASAGDTAGSAVVSADVGADNTRNGVVAATDAQNADATSATGEATEGAVDAAAGGRQQTTEQLPQTATINIPKEALRQITTLSASNRTLKAQNAELLGKVAELTKAPPTDIAAKLALLEQYEKGPLHQLLALRKVDLEAVAADVYANASAQVEDPRVVELTTRLTAAEKRIEDTAKAAEKQQEASTLQLNQQQLQQASAHIESIVANTKTPAGAVRWQRLVNDKEVPTKAIQTASLIVKRDYDEKKDDTGKVVRVGRRPTQEEATKILHKVLDKMEADKLAAELVTANNTRQAPAAKAPSNGIRIIDEPAAAPRRAAAAPSITIGPQRGPLTAAAAQQVPRGPTNVREARRRMRIIAGLEEP